MLGSDDEERAAVACRRWRPFDWYIQMDCDQYSAPDGASRDRNLESDNPRDRNEAPEDKEVTPSGPREISPEVGAQQYLEQGWSPIPVPRGEKAPRFKGWTKYVCDPTRIDEIFSGSNVGVLLGEPSGGLVDVDLDCTEAEQLAKVVLPSTDAVFGRNSKPTSHYLYITDPIPKTKRFRDLDGTTLVELRSARCQTVFPGSTHPSGEHVVWVCHGSPQTIAADELSTSVARLAAVSLLARHWPTQGSREDAALAVAGGLRRAGMSDGRIPAVVEAIATAAGDEEAEARRKAAQDTLAKIDAKEAVTGWPSLAKLIDPKVVAKCCEWLGDRQKLRQGGGGGRAGGGDGEDGDVGGTPERDGDGGDGRGRGQKSYAQMLVELAEEQVVEFFRDGDQSYATYHVGEGPRRHRENHGLRTKPFKQYLRLLFYDRHRTPPGSQAVQDAIEQLDAHTQFRGQEISVFLRVAPGENAIFVDLCHPQWLAVRITPNWWEVVREVPVKFVRRRGMTGLRLPVPWGSLDLLRPFLNAKDDDSWALIVGWLLMALGPRGPYPILVVNGEQGSAKSTASRMLRALVDPSRVPLRSEPRGQRDLVIAAENAHVLAFDNLSALRPWLSDGLCRTATGGGFGTRELYTDAEERLFWSTRPIIINGISDFGTRSDLVDRSLCVTLPEMGDNSRRAERELWSAFRDAFPRILGGVFEAVAAALANWSTVSLPTLPRMADFAQWVTAAEPRLGWVPGRFLAAYSRNADAASQTALESSPIAPPLMHLIQTRNHWKGSATELLAELNRSTLVSEKTRNGRFWPDDAAYLGVLLRRIAPNLRRAGYTVRSGRTKDGRWWELDGPKPVPDTIQAPTSSGQSSEGDGRVTGGDTRELSPENGDSGGGRREKYGG